MKVGEIIRRKQPQVYKQLRFMYQEQDEGNREIEVLMRHDGYRRVAGAIRQIRR